MLSVTGIGVLVRGLVCGHRCHCAVGITWKILVRGSVWRIRCLCTICTGIHCTAGGRMLRWQCTHTGVIGLSHTRIRIRMDTALLWPCSRLCETWINRRSQHLVCLTSRRYYLVLIVHRHLTRGIPLPVRVGIWVVAHFHRERPCRIFVLWKTELNGLDGN